METNLPIAVVIGSENFLAKKLVEELVEREISVIGIKNEIDGELEENFEWRTDVEEIEVKVSYVFDFEAGDIEVWKRAEQDQAKLTIVMIDKPRRWIENIKKKLDDFDIDARIIETGNLYGEGMDGSNVLGEIFKQAVNNETLVLPKPSKNIRPLYIGDGVEGILRATFLSGTKKRWIVLGGKQINFGKIALILTEEAKMTKEEVVLKDRDFTKYKKKDVYGAWKKLRWKPEMSFENGVSKTMHYFFENLENSGLFGKTRKGKGFWYENGEKEKNEKKKGEKTKKKKKLLIEKIKNEKDNSVGDVVISKILPKDENVFEIKNLGKISLVKENGKEKLVMLGDIKTEDIRIKNLRVRNEIVVEKKIEIKEKKKSFIKTIRGVVLVLLLMIVGFVVWWVGRGVLIAGQIREVEELINKRDYIKAERLVNKTIKNIEKLDEDIIKTNLNKFNIFRNYQGLVRIGGEVAIIEKEGIPLVRASEEIWRAIFEGKKIEWSEEIKRINLGLESVERATGRLEARLDDSQDWMKMLGDGKIKKEKEKINLIRQKINLGREVLEILPDFVAMNGKRTYLILLQNEMELRPGGGFIGSYMVVNFDSGKMSFEIKDVYDTDGQLKGHVEPPEEIKTHLGEAGWYLRDANWKADFEKSAKDVAWFYDQESKNKVDGVLSMNLATVKAILGVVGEIKVPDFKEKIDSNNLYERAEYYSEKKFFPGSNQKSSFLSGIAKQLFEEMKLAKSNKRAKIIEAVLEMLERNEIQIALFDDKGAKMMTTLGWSGAMYGGRCQTDRCFADYLYIVEANLGVNKANYFIKRKIEKEVNVGLKSIERVLKLDYENVATSKTQPAGDYKNYMRIYLPGSVSVSEVAVIDERNVRQVYTTESLKVKQIGSKKELGFLVTVPIRSRRRVEVKYKDDLNLQSKKEFSYLSYIQKQSGFGETGIVVTIKVPNGFKVKQIEPETVVENNLIIYNQSFDRDIKLGIEIVR